MCIESKRHGTKRLFLIIPLPLNHTNGKKLFSYHQTFAWSIDLPSTRTDCAGVASKLKYRRTFAWHGNCAAYSGATR